MSSKAARVNPKSDQPTETGTLVRAVGVALGLLERTGDFDVRRLLAEGEIRPESLLRELTRSSDVIARKRRVPLEQLIEAAATNGVVLAQVPAGWLVLHGRRGKWVTASGERSIGLTPKRLRSVGVADEQDVVLLEPRLGLESLRREDGQKSPWGRLRSLLRLEAAEVRAIIAYGIVLGGLSLAVPIAVQVLVNTIALGSLLQPLVVLSVLLFGTLLLAGSLQLLQWYATEVVQRKLFVRVAEDFARRLPTVRYSVHETRDVREAVNRFFEAASLQKSVGTLLLDGLALALMTLTGMLLLAFYHPALLAFSLVLSLGLALVILLGYGSVRTAVEESKAKYELAAWLENVAARPTLFHRREAATLATITADKLTRDYLEQRRKHYARVLRQLSAGLGIQIVAMVALLGLGGALVIEGELTLGQLVAAELVVGRVASGFAKLGKHFERFYDLMASLDKLGGVLDLATDPPPLPPAFERPRVVLDQVVVGARDVPCQALTTTCIPGRHVWVSGGDAGQRDELFEVIAGLRPPSSGSIELFDTSSEARTTSQNELKAHSLLLRAGEIVDGTVADNLRLLCPTATESELRSALAAVGLSRTVDRLPRGLDTPLLMSGAPLTRQQAARLCLARLHLVRPTVVALDDIIDDADFDRTEKERVLNWVLSDDAPWTALVTSGDSAVRQRCGAELSLYGKEVAA